MISTVEELIKALQEENEPRKILDLLLLVEVDRSIPKAMIKKTGFSTGGIQLSKDCANFIAGMVAAMGFFDSGTIVWNNICRANQQLLGKEELTEDLAWYHKNMEKHPDGVNYTLWGGKNLLAAEMEERKIKETQGILAWAITYVISAIRLAQIIPFGFRELVKKYEEDGEI